MSTIDYTHRSLIILQTISRNKYISLNDLTREVANRIFYYDDSGKLGTSSKTIDREMKKMKKGFNIDIKYCRRNKGYFIEENELEEADLTRLLESFDILGSLYADKQLPSFIFLEKFQLKGTEHILPFVHAINNSLIVEFFYQKYDNTSSHVRKVEPYALKEFKGRWYLLAIEIDGRIEERGAIKTWGLDRIKHLNVSNKYFSKNRHIKIETEFENAFGIFADREKETEDVVLSFSSVGGKYVNTFPLHWSQEVISETDKELIIRLKIKLTYDFIMELLAQSENVKVLEPLHLRDTLINIHENAIKKLR